MSNPKLGISQKNQPMHYSVGALIKENNKYLLIDRIKPPYGFAGIAGHIDRGETKVDTLIREIKEESELEVKKYNLLFEEEIENNQCSKGIDVHYWYLFKCDVTGHIRKNAIEAKSIGWYSKSQIKQLKLEPVWEYWFKKLKII